MSKAGSVARRVTLTAALALGGVLILAHGAQAGSSQSASSSLDWSQYLHGPQHSSVSSATAFTPANAASSSETWHWQPPVVTGERTPNLDASPTVVAGRVYIGAQSGGFYALNEATGTVDWSRQLDTEPAKTCPARGVTSTAAVLPDPVTGTSTVYVSGARYLYALNAVTGAVAWKTEIGPSKVSTPDAYYNWSSPTVVGGHIYVGLSSSCDTPQIRGGVVELDQHTGQVLHTWYSVPAGSIGGSVWSSVAASTSGSDIWVATGDECEATTGNPCPAGDKVGNSLAVVQLSASLGMLHAYQPSGLAGHDWDFGSSPTLFGGTGTPPDVGSCNKDGMYYALVDNPLGSSPLWTDTIGAPAAASTGSCIASAVWDGQTGGLFIGGDATTIGTKSYGGSIRLVNPKTGSYIWQTGLPSAVMGTPSLDSAGVLAAATYSCTKPSKPGAYLVNASTGAILKTLPVGSTLVFAQPVFAQSALFVATETDGLYDFAP